MTGSRLSKKKRTCASSFSCLRKLESKPILSSDKSHNLRSIGGVRRNVLKPSSGVTPPSSASSESATAITFLVEEANTCDLS